MSGYSTGNGAMILSFITGNKRTCLKLTAEGYLLLVPTEHWYTDPDLPSPDSCFFLLSTSPSQLSSNVLFSVQW